MYVCMNVCMYVCAHACMYVSTYVNKYVCMVGPSLICSCFGSKTCALLRISVRAFVAEIPIWHMTDGV